MEFRLCLDQIEFDEKGRVIIADEKLNKEINELYKNTADHNNYILGVTTDGRCSCTMNGGV
jgi:hypothetical protein